MHLGGKKLKNKMDLRRRKRNLLSNKKRRGEKKTETTIKTFLKNIQEALLGQP
jgi:hypothetical protein